MNQNESKWETIDLAYNSSTERLRVEGGYIYHVGNNACKAIAICFVPDVDLQRYQAHLRDAYTKGFADGLEEGKAFKNDK